MSGQIDVVGSFPDEGMCIDGIEALKSANVKPTRVFAPIPSEHIGHAMGYKPSSVRLFVLAGGIIGALIGFAITIGTSLEWGINAGGRPIISLPPYIVIAFECMILGGGVSGVLGFLFSSRMPVTEAVSGYSAHFSAERFGVLVRCAETDRERIEGIFKEAGAETLVHEVA